MIKFYIKHADMYLIQIGSYEWFANKPVYTKDKTKAGKFTDAIYNNIKSKLPNDHTLELAVDEKAMPKWFKNALISVLLYFLCGGVILLIPVAVTTKVYFAFMAGFFSNDIVRWITKR